MALIVSYFLALMADKAAYIGYLVYAYDQGGSGATALTSIITITPLFVLGPIVTRALAKERPNQMRGWWHMAQAIALGAAAYAAASESHLAVVIAASTVAVGASAIMLPGVAMLSPAVCRTADELVAANLWISYVNSIGALAAPFGAAILLATGGSPAVLFGTAAAAGLSAIITLGMTPLTLPSAPVEVAARRAGLTTVRELPGGTAILLAGATHYALLTMVGIVAVVLARSTLQLGESGPGMLNLAYGVGAFASSLLVGRALRRRALTPVVVASVAASGLAYVAVAAVPELAVALVGYVVLGIGRVTAESTTRVMLQRISTPAAMAGAFAVLQAALGLGGIVGSGLVQLLLSIATERVALTALGVLLLVLAVALWTMLRRADAAGELPLVEMTLLRRIPLLSSMPDAELEVLARHGQHVDVEAGDVVIAEGEAGDTFYAIVDGALDVSIDDAPIRCLRRGQGFGEVALLANVNRTATITAQRPSTLLAIGRSEFLAALTGSPFAERAAWSGMAELHFAEGTRPDEHN